LNELRSFVGITDNPKVTLINDEGRAFFSRNDIKCSLLQMSLIDTWAATGAGAFSLSEHSLYTVEAWQLFYNHLEPNGIFTVSRWYNPTMLGETGRMVSLAVSTLLSMGIEDPQKHIALVTSEQIATLILSKSPLQAADMLKLNKAIQEMKFTLALGTSILIAIVGLFSSGAVSMLIGKSSVIKIASCLGAIGILGLLIGCFFPLGMRLIAQRIEEASPWFWGLNGIFGALSASIAVLVSIFCGISVTFMIASICYLLLVPVVFYVTCKEYSFY